MQVLNSIEMLIFCNVCYIIFELVQSIYLLHFSLNLWNFFVIFFAVIYFIVCFRLVIFFSVTFSFHFCLFRLLVFFLLFIVRLILVYVMDKFAMDVLKCSASDKTFSADQSLRRHVGKKHPDYVDIIATNLMKSKTYTSETGSANFNSEVNFKQHTKKHKSDDKTHYSSNWMCPHSEQRT